MKDNVIVKLSERDHVLLRPQQYIGSIDEVTSEEFLIDNGKIEKKEITYVPALVKIINEILDNSIDEAVRTNFKHANKIDVKIDENTVSIKDNGRGIPVVKVAGTDKYGPDVAFCEARAGANFDDDNRKTIGANGVGSFCCNVFSISFHVDTSDGKNRFVLKCKDNLAHASHKVTPSTKNYTQVTFKPDLKRFSLTEITEVHMNMIKQRLYYLSICHPSVRFTFNGKTIKWKHGKEMISKFSETFEIIEKEDFFISVIPAIGDDFSYFTYVNGLYIKSGGNHINYITTEIVSRLRDKLVKKYKGIKPGDIKNKLQLVMFMNDFPDARFSSQTKEELTNSVPSIKEYLSLTEEDLEKFVNKIYKNKTLMDSITELFRAKEEMKRRADLKGMSKVKKKLKIEKYIPAAKENKYLVLAEGDSAVGGISKVLGRNEFAYFALRGKSLNVYEAAVSKITANAEWKHITQILGLDLTDPDTDMEFENVLIATDADLDGILIRGLILTFFNRFAPKLVAEGRIQVLVTPMITAEKKGIIEDYFMSFEEYSKHQKKTKNFHYNYYKGLGSWRGKEDLGYLVEKHGIDNFIDAFKSDDKCQEVLKNWMSKAGSDKRKAYLRGKAFDIFKL